MSKSDPPTEGEITEHGLPPGITLDDAERRLAAYVQERLGDASLRTTGFKRLDGGASNHTFLLTMESPGSNPVDLIIRWDPGVGVVEPYDMGMQFRIVDGLSASDVPVAPARWLEEDTSVLGRAFYVVDRVNGEIGDRVIQHGDPIRQARLRRAHVEALATIHAVDWRALGLDQFMRVPGAGTDYALHELARWEQVVQRKQLEPDKLMEDVAEWLRTNAPETTEVRLLHGDDSGTNYMYRDDKVVAVIDWEMSTLGDPMIDVAWYCGCILGVGPMFGLTQQAAQAAKAEFLATYAEVTGREINKQALRWGEVFCLYQVMSVTISGQWLARQQGAPAAPMGPSPLGTMLRAWIDG